jgi:Fe-S-cluster containining protein
MEYLEDLEKAANLKDKNQKLLRKLGKGKTKVVDSQFHERHDAVFEKIDCLKCANCCKTTSPIFRDVDIQRLSNFLRVSVADFQKRYLQMDSDGDWVLQSSPCPFLYEDNTCAVYEVRPKACSEYPHTDRKNMQQILDLTFKNSLICPAVARILERISEQQK